MRIIIEDVKTAPTTPALFSRFSHSPFTLSATQHTQTWYIKIAGLAVIREDGRTRRADHSAQDSRTGLEQQEQSQAGKQRDPGLERDPAFGPL